MKIRHSWVCTKKVSYIIAYRCKNRYPKKLINILLISIIVSKEDHVNANIIAIPKRNSTILCPKIRVKMQEALYFYYSYVNINYIYVNEYIL